MIVCSCNRLSDRDIRNCAKNAQAPLRPLDVYGLLGCKPQCGRCGPTIAAILRDIDKAPAARKDDAAA